jgi:signal transduction histidine kinase
VSGKARPRIPTSLFARLVALLAVTLLLTQVVGGLLFFLVNPPPDHPIVRVSEIAATLRAEIASNPRIEQTEPRAPDALRMTDIEPLLARRLGLPVEDVRLSRERRPTPQPLKSLLRPPPGAPPPPIDALDPSDGDPMIFGGYRASARTPQGWVSVRARPPEVSDVLGRMVLWLAVSLAFIAPLAILLAARVTSPITAFADAADRLGRDPYSPPMRYSGPAEVIQAVQAFNEMQARLREYIDDRVLMVGAIAHDLRTPLTRLQLQLQALPTPVRTRAEGEIERMQLMIEGALAYVKDASSASERIPLRLFSLVEAVIDDMPSAFDAITLEAGPDPVVLGDETGLRRVFANLLDNAVSYGDQARCRVETSGPWAIVQIDDAGPGLAAADLDRAFEPYVRFNGDRAGIGLGLSIVRTIVRAHGGEATLSNRLEGGLRVEVRLPLATALR